MHNLNTVRQKGEIFISPLDLNIEQGKIEQPLKPMLRLGTLIFDSSDKKKRSAPYKLLSRKFG